MAKIIEFPFEERLEKVLLSQLLNRMKELDVVYQSLDKTHEFLNTLEKEASMMEKEYDKYLTQYAKLIGGENLEVDMLHYSQNTKITSLVEEGEFKIEWAGEPNED